MCMPLPLTRAGTVVVAPAMGLVRTVHDVNSEVFPREDLPASDAAQGAGKKVEPVRGVWFQFKPFKIEGVIEQDVCG